MPPAADAQLLKVADNIRAGQRVLVSREMEEGRSELMRLRVYVSTGLGQRGEFMPTVWCIG